MPTTRKILRVFLASPGDLQDERQAIRRVVDEFNETWADDRGYSVELLGWEDTVAGYGRPQHLINQDVDRCDHFLGMIWKRWGTPPDHDGPYSSGFQEEYARAIDRRTRTNGPDISLFFKRIPKEFIEDPGDDLKRVLAFRNSVIAEKRMLYQEFSTVEDMEVLARKCIATYVIRTRKRDESNETTEVTTKRVESQSNTPERANTSLSSSVSPLSAQGHSFLESLVGRLRHEDEARNVNATDVARFRLLANLITRRENQETDVGVHDINILYVAYANGMELGSRELQFLVRLGFRHMAAENVPLWVWYGAHTSSDIDMAVASSVVGTDNERIGAINTLSLLSKTLPTEDHRWVVKSWFDDNTSGSVRCAALDYLADNGAAGDYEIVKREFDRNESSTTAKALCCTIAILLRTGRTKQARQIFLESERDIVDAETVRKVLEGFDEVDTGALIEGLVHSNVQTRLRALRILYQREAVSMDLAERLCEDGDATVRREAIDILESLGRPRSDEEVERILVQRDKRQTLGIWGQMQVATGEEAFRQYKLEKLQRATEAELSMKVENSQLYVDDEYFVRAEKYFMRYGNELRGDVDDQFLRYRGGQIRRMEKLFENYPPGRDTIQRARELDDFCRKGLTRRGLDVLCRMGSREDVERIRNNLRSCYAGPSGLDLEYLARYGEWADVPLLAGADEWHSRYVMKVARAILRAGRGRRISEIVAIEMPGPVLKAVIEWCADVRYRDISDEALFRVLSHESADVRKAAAIKAVLVLPVRRIRAVLREYSEGDRYRYYNVIHWLDLGASMRRREARQVARAAGG